MPQEVYTAAEWRARQAKPRRKHGNVPCRLGEHGVRFDSKAERYRYVDLMLDSYVIHVDVHPTFTLDAPANIRYTADFTVWSKWAGISLAHVEDVKSPVTLAKSDFVKNWKLFNAHHPLAPLWVVLRGPGGKGWIVLTDPDEARKYT